MAGRCKGNPNPDMSGLISFDKMDKDKHRKAASKGGKKAAKTRAERKTIAEALRIALYSPSEWDSSKLVIDDLIASVLSRCLEKGNPSDLEALTRILGELISRQEVNASADIKGDVSVKQSLFKLDE